MKPIYLTVAVLLLMAAGLAIADGCQVLAEAKSGPGEHTVQKANGRDAQGGGVLVSRPLRQSR